MREAAGLTGRQFATLAGWRDGTKVSKVEKGIRPASPADVALWCEICGATEQRKQELLAEQRAVAGMWVTYQQLNRGGLKQAQESVRARYERVRLMRTYVTKVVPGLLQTAAYTTAALEAARLEQQVEIDDVAGAVAERMDRQSVLHRSDARFVFVLEEEVLRHRTTDVATHAAQLRHLLTTMRLPAVSLGIIPWSADRTVGGPGVWPEESFIISDSALVTVELVSGYLSITQPEEIAAYLRAWDRLFPLAVHGARAVACITAAMQALDGEGAERDGLPRT